MNKICKDCNMEKDIKEFPKLRKVCKLCLTNKRKEYMKLYRENNKVKLDLYKKEYMISYYNENKVKIKEYIKNYNKETNYNNNYRKNKYNTDFLYRLKCLYRTMINDAYTNNGYKKNSKSANMLGCSFEDFRIYIFNQFETWMTESNQGTYTGNYNETWQLDHIIPISNASSIEDVIRLNHYTNLRPLCSRKNVEKSNH
jgi:5-methylcytosine-specific restriction endonuclease McrA